MSSEGSRSLTLIGGFALGVGICAVAVVGVPLRFALAEVDAWLLYLLSFAGGLALGVLWGAARGARS